MYVLILVRPAGALEGSSTAPWPPQPHALGIPTSLKRLLKVGLEDPKAPAALPRGSFWCLFRAPLENCKSRSRLRGRSLFMVSGVSDR